MWGLVEYKKVCASSYIESKWTAEKNNSSEDREEFNKTQDIKDVLV